MASISTPHKSGKSKGSAPASANKHPNKCFGTPMLLASNILGDSIPCFRVVSFSIKQTFTKPLKPQKITINQQLHQLFFFPEVRGFSGWSLRLSKISRAWQLLFQWANLVAVAVAGRTLVLPKRRWRIKTSGSGLKHERQRRKFLVFKNPVSMMRKTTGNKKFRTLQVLHQGKSNVLIIESPELCAILCSQSLKTLGSSRPNPTLHRRFFVISKEFNLPITPALLMNRFISVTRWDWDSEPPGRRHQRHDLKPAIWNKRFVRATGCEHGFVDWFYNSDFRNMIHILNLWIPTSWLPDSLVKQNILQKHILVGISSENWSILIILIIIFYEHG